MKLISGNQRPDLLTSLLNMSLVLRLPLKMHLCRYSSNVLRLPSFWKFCKTLKFSSLLTRYRLSCACHGKRRLNVQRWSEHVMFFNILTWIFSPHNGVHFFNISTKSAPTLVCVLHLLTSTCASRHNGVHFFDFSTSKSGPRMVCFLHFYLDMCFAPQRRALCFTSQFPKVVWDRQFLALRATTACNFSSLIWPDGSAPTFRPSGAANHWKNTANRDFPTFSHACLFFLLTVPLLWSSLFFSSLLWLFPRLLFPTVHLVGGFTSKLPSMISSLPFKKTKCSKMQG